MNDLTLRALDALKKHGFTVHAFETAADMADFVVNDIPTDASVGFGGSMTVRSLDIYDRLAQRGCTLNDHGRGSTPDEREELIRRELCSDIYIMSSNAVTAGGKLYNVDGRGNRVAALAGGPATAYILLGENKFVETDGDAVERVRTVAAPKNTVRHNSNTPCVATGHCMDCSSPDRICNMFLWTERPRMGQTIHICVCPEDLGY